MGNGDQLEEEEGGNASDAMLPCSMAGRKCLSSAILFAASYLFIVAAASMPCLCHTPIVTLNSPDPLAKFARRE